MNDIKYALRGFMRSPGFTAIAVLSLALGIGANVTIYTIANSFLERPIPGASRTESLARVYRGSHSPLQYSDLAFVRKENSVFTEIIGERMLPVAVANGDAMERVQGALVTDGYFSMLGVRAQHGRLISDADSTEANAIVISDALLQRRFGGDPRVLGQVLRINDHPFTIVGVAAPEFMSSIALWRADVWFPPKAAETLTGIPFDRWGGSLYITARLRPEASVAQANANMATLASRITANDPEGRENFTLRVDHARGITAELRAPATAASAFLLAVVALVLLIACANVANLLLARATARRREMGVRIALGAGRIRLVRQLLTESALLAVAAGVLGIIAAAWIADSISRYVVSRSPEPVSLGFTPDASVMAFTVVVSAITTLLFGLFPALRATSLRVLPVLREEAAQTSAKSKTRSTLIAMQVALCTVLLACATLFLRSLANARVMDPGFNASGVVDMSLDLRSRNLDSLRGAQFYDRLLERARALPGVRSATVAALVPLGGSNMQTGTWVKGEHVEGSRAPHAPYFNIVGMNYFRTLGISVIQGREFSAADKLGAEQVVIVNEQMARRLWPNESPLGKSLSVQGATGPWATIIGVVKNTKYNGLGEATPEFMYLPFAQHHRDEMVLHVRGGDDVSAVTRALPALVRELDPQLPPATAALLTDDMRIALLPAQLGASLLGAFGLLALALATVGIYGVASYSVAQRTRELGIRSALGATRDDVMKLVLGQAMRTVLIGAAVGLALALVVAKLIASQLYGVRPTDPATFIAMPLFLIGVALLATLIPARRATKVQPIEALRAQ